VRAGRSLRARSPRAGRARQSGGQSACVSNASVGVSGPAGFPRGGFVVLLALYACRDHPGLVAAPLQVRRVNARLCPAQLRW
jgi:hypothetical protein